MRTEPSSPPVKITCRVNKMCQSQPVTAGKDTASSDMQAVSERHLQSIVQCAQHCKCKENIPGALGGT